MEDDRRQDLIARLFALLTMKLEDAAAVAADGQGSDISGHQMRELADRLYASVIEIETLSQAVLAVLLEP